MYHPAGNQNHGEASVYAGLVPGGQSFEVTVDRLDALVQTVPHLVKFDVQGAEFDAMRGAEKLWTAESPPAVIFEHAPECSEAAGYKPSELLRWITGIQPKYEIFWIDWRLVRITDPATVDRQTRQGNLLLLPRAK